MAYTLSDKCAKNLSKRTVLLQLIIKNVVTCFFWITCIYTGRYNKLAFHSLASPWLFSSHLVVIYYICIVFVADIFIVFRKSQRRTTDGDWRVTGEFYNWTDSRRVQRCMG